VSGACVADTDEPVRRGSPGQERVALLPLWRQRQRAGPVGGGDAGRSARRRGRPVAASRTRRGCGCQGAHSKSSGLYNEEIARCHNHDEVTLTVPGSYTPNGGTPGTSAAKDAARNPTFGTVIPRCIWAPTFPTSLFWMSPRRGSAFETEDRQRETSSGGCPHVEPPTNGDRSAGREPVVLKGRREERVSF
jgi:hypothetical protein